MQTHWLRLTLIAFFLLLAGPAAAQRASFESQVDERVEELLTFEDGVERKAIEKRYGELVMLANTVAARAGARQMSAVVRCEGALGMLELVVGANAGDAGELIERFRAHPAFMAELGLLLHRGDDTRGVAELASRLMEERSEQVRAFPALAAAVCVVHDMQRGEAFTRRVNEHNPESPDPLAIFDYYVGNARMLSIDPGELPAIALVYVVDTTETPEQMQWALGRFRTNPSISDRFFEIEYDYLHFQQSKPKRVTAEPGDYNIQKINRYGGVCADQAYYAMSVAKACGIPSAYVRARGADVSHAWVGFVEKRGRRAAWNFEAGRYDEYQQLRGNLLDPQTREWISDGRAGVLGNAMSSGNEDVLASMAAARVVERMSAGAWRTDEEIELETRGNHRTTRTSDIEDRLDLLRAALSRSAGVPAAWDLVVELAAAGEMDEQAMDVWASAVMRLAGRQHQDFAYDFLVDLIATVDEAERQHEMWEWAFSQFRARPDLAAGVRFRQGELWARNDNLEYAWLAYNDVVDRFINEGPMVVSALDSMRRMLQDAGKGAEIIPVLENASKRVRKPGDMSAQFAVQSNYYRIHKMLAEAYEEAGRASDARRIRMELGR